MRSQVLKRYSTTAILASLAATAAQAVNLSIVFPLDHLQLAWTLTRVLLQL